MLAFPRRLLRVTVAAPDQHAGGRARRRHGDDRRDRAIPGRPGSSWCASSAPSPTRTSAWSPRRRPARRRRRASRCGAQRRGQMHVDAVWLRWRGPLGLVELTRRIEVGRAIDVRAQRARRAQLGAAVPRRARRSTASRCSEQKGEGTEFEALRDYVPGMDSRFIDWKHSARHRRLVCKEFRTERNHQIILAFDTGYLMVEPVDGLPRLDHAINAGLLLAWISLQGGDFVGLLGVRRDAAAVPSAAPRRVDLPAAAARHRRARLPPHRDQFHARPRRAELAAAPPRARHPVHRFRRHRHGRADDRGDAADRAPARGDLRHAARRGAARHRRRGADVVRPTSRNRSSRTTSCATAASCSSGSAGSACTASTCRAAACRSG